MNGSRFRIPMTPDAEAAWIKECKAADLEIEQQYHKEAKLRAPSPEKQKAINHQKYLRKKAKEKAGKLFV